MQLLLEYLIIVEPDRQRLSRYILDAVAALDGDIFAATISLNRIMDELAVLLKKSEQTIEILLMLEDYRILVSWKEKTVQVATIPFEPGAEKLEEVSTRLRQQSELADPELLRQRNSKISADLEMAKSLAAEEMAQLETKLEERRLELEQTQHIAETDSLTGLYNHGAFDQHFVEAIARCQRQSEPLCLIMLDLDKFKNINDTHGHLYGDDYLKNTAEIMRQACRINVDFCCRLGGDEFAIIVFSDLTHTERIAKVILKQMKKQISIGIAQHLPTDTAKSLMQRCDSVLYEAKAAGRGRIVVSHIKSVTREKSVK
jgi:diguanylate cyclase (GGDEF)-like protein